MTLHDGISPRIGQIPGIFALFDGISPRFRQILGIFQTDSRWYVDAMLAGFVIDVSASTRRRSLNVYAVMLAPDFSMDWRLTPAKLTIYDFQSACAIDNRG